jgi:repressor LexA
MKKDFNKLSERQRNILRFIRSYVEQHGYPPTIRQIGEATGINSTSVVNYNLNKLVQAEYLARSQHVSRGLRLVTNLPGERKRKQVQVSSHIVKVPMYGTIFASEPVHVPDDYYPEEEVEVTPTMLGGGDPENVFALTVKGDSMKDAMVKEGDVVILRKQPTVKNGDMVAVWLTDRSETTLKYFFNEGARIRLQPAHPDMGPIYVDPQHCQVEGRVLSIIRQL